MRISDTLVKNQLTRVQAQSAQSKSSHICSRITVKKTLRALCTYCLHSGSFPELCLGRPRTSAGRLQGGGGNLMHGTFLGVLFRFRCRIGQPSIRTLHLASAARPARPMASSTPTYAVRERVAGPQSGTDDDRLTRSRTPSRCSTRRRRDIKRWSSDGAMASGWRTRTRSGR